MHILVAVLLLLSCAVARADLKTLLHGPQPKTSGTPAAQAATVVYAPGAIPDEQVTSFLMAFAEAVRTGDGALVRTRLSDRYTIDELPPEHSAAELFLHGISSLAGKLDEIVINSIEREGEVRVAKLEFRSGGKTSPRMFKYDPAGKLLYANFFSLRRHGEGKAAGK